MDEKEITLEKIELVKDRTGITYKEAKEALEFAGGSVVDAIIHVEETINAENGGKKEKYVNSAVDAIKDAVRKGNINRVSVKKDGKVLLNIPVSIGVLGTVLFPWAAVASVIAAFGTKCVIEMVKDDGEIVNISDKANGAIDIAVSKGEVIFNEAKDKGSDAVDYVAEKGGDFLKFAKEKVDFFSKKVEDSAEKVEDFVEDLVEDNESGEDK